MSFAEEELARVMESKSGNGESNKGQMKDFQENFAVSSLNTEASCRFILVLCKNLMLKCLSQCGSELDL